VVHDDGLEFGISSGLIVGITVPHAESFVPRVSLRGLL
jgi:hypothetical protein